MPLGMFAASNSNADLGGNRGANNRRATDANNTGGHGGDDDRRRRLDGHEVQLAGKHLDYLQKMREMEHNYLHKLHELEQVYSPLLKIVELPVKVPGQAQGAVAVHREWDRRS